MQRQRYMIFEYSLADEQQIRIGSTGLENHVPIHELLTEYHYSRIDSDHIMILGSYPLSHHQHLEANIKLSILPHLASGKALHKAVKKPQHWYSLRQHLQLDDESLSMTDIIDHIDAKCGPVFGPLR